jgi:hypothetical protein
LKAFRAEKKKTRKIPWSYSISIACRLDSVSSALSVPGFSLIGNREDRAGRHWSRQGNWTAPKTALEMFYSLILKFLKCRKCTWIVKPIKLSRLHHQVVIPYLCQTVRRSISDQNIWYRYIFSYCS